MGLNPFFHRKPVHDPASFFGRREEVDYVFSLLCQGQSVSISGQRRFGKTSLLYYLSLPEINRQFGLDPAQTRWVNLEGGLLDGLDEDWLYGAINHALGHDEESTSYIHLMERVRALDAQGHRLIIAFDEFELFARNTQLQPRVFNRLRGLGDQFAIQFVTASREPLARLFFAYPEVISSPFFNNFATLRLGLFQEAEAIEMLSTLSARGGQAFAAETMAFILELVGPHPLFLQIAGYHAFAAQEHGVLSSEARTAVVNRVTQDLDGHLRYYWNSLLPDERYALAVLPISIGNNQTAVSARLAEAGLTYRNRYLGTALRDFVSEQPVEGLIRCGPFVMVENRGILTVDGQVVHLTPTEFAALRLFLQNPGHLLAQEDIEAVLWPGDTASDSERVRPVITRLRAALGEAGNAIVNERGRGYLLRCN